MANTTKIMWWIKCKFSVKYEILLTNQEVDLYDIFMEQYLTASIHFKFRFHASTPTYHFIFSFTLFIPLDIPTVFELNSVAVTVWLSQLICSLHLLPCTFIIQRDIKFNFFECNHSWPSVEFQNRRPSTLCFWLKMLFLFSHSTTF